jgi:hypothetical protein
MVSPRVVDHAEVDELCVVDALLLSCGMHIATIAHSKADELQVLRAGPRGPR